MFLGVELGEFINETNILILLLNNSILIETPLSILKSNKPHQIKVIRQLHESEGMVEMKVHELEEINNKQ